MTPTQQGKFRSFDLVPWMLTVCLTGVFINFLILSAASASNDQPLYYDRWNDQNVYYGWRFQSATAPTDKLIVRSIVYEYERRLPEIKIGTDQEKRQIYQNITERRQELQRHYAEIEAFVGQGIDPNTSDLPSSLQAGLELLKLTDYGVPLQVIESSYTLGKDFYDVLTRPQRLGVAQDNFSAALSGHHNIWLNARLLGMDAARYAQADPEFKAIIDEAVGSKVGVSAGATEEEIVQSDPGLIAWKETLGLKDNLGSMDVRLVNTEAVLQKFADKIKEKEALLKEQAKKADARIKRAETFSELYAIQYMTTQALSLVGPETAQTFSQVSGNLISLIDASDKLNTQMFNPGETALSIASVALGNIFSLINIFMSLTSEKESPFKILYDALNERLTILEENLHRHLNVIHQDVMDGLHQLSVMIQKGFQSLHRDLKQNQELLLQIQAKVNILEDWERYNAESTAQDHLEQYEVELTKALQEGFGEDGSGRDLRMIPDHLIEILRVPYNFATYYASKLNVFMRTEPTVDFRNQYYHQALRQPYLDRNLRVLLSLAQPEADISRLETLVNPLAWAKGSYVFVDMLERWPDVTAQFSDARKELIADQVDKLIQEGQGLQKSTDGLFYELRPDGSKRSVRASFFLKLVKNYLQALYEADRYLREKRRGYFEDQEPFAIDVWRDIDYQIPDPRLSDLVFLIENQPMDSSTTDLLSPFFALMIPRPFLLAQRLGVGQIRITLGNPGWTEIDVVTRERGLYQVYEVRGVLTVDVKIDFLLNLEDPTKQVVIPLGIFSIQDHRGSQNIAQRGWFCAWNCGPDRWKTRHQANLQEQFKSFFENPNDILISVAKKILDIEKVGYAQFVGRSGVFASTDYKDPGFVTELVAPIQQDFSKELKSYGRWGDFVFDGTGALNLSSIAAYDAMMQEFASLQQTGGPIDYVSMARTLLLDNFKSYGDSLHIAWNYRVQPGLTFDKINSGWWTPYAIVRLEGPQRDELRQAMRRFYEESKSEFQRRVEDISFKVESQIKDHSVIQKLNGQHALMKAFLSLGLPSSIQSDEILQSFFHPHGANQLIHGDNLFDPQHRMRFLALGIYRIKLLTTFLFNSVLAERLPQLFVDDNPELAEFIQHIGSLYVLRAREIDDMLIPLVDRAFDRFAHLKKPDREGMHAYIRRQDGQDVWYFSIPELEAYLKNLDANSYVELRDFLIRHIHEHYTDKGKEEINPIVLERMDGFLQAHLETTQSPEVIWKTLVWLEQFKRYWQTR